MTQEDKDLLLKDLCARLPYGVMCVLSEPPHGEIIEPLRTGGLRAFIEDKWMVKPYLRPMESMTENEYDEWLAVSNDGGWGVTEGLIAQCADWLNARHFDYRGLIPKNLAIAVTEEDNPYKA